MSEHVRASAAAAWAVANAAADIPGSEVCSVAFGQEAGLTLAPGKVAPKMVAVMDSGAGTENWDAGVALLEENLRLDDAIRDDLMDPTGESRTNALILVVSDLQYGMPNQATHAVLDIAKWREAGFRVVLASPLSADEVRKEYYGGVLVPYTNGAYGYESVDSEIVRKALDGIESVTGTESRDTAAEFDRL
jgi:hypothetical protein